MVGASKQSKKISVQSKKNFFTYRGGNEIHRLDAKKSTIHLYNDIITLLSKGYYRQEIADLLGLSKQRIYYYCKKLEKAGFIAREPRTSIIPYRVYYEAWKSYLKLLKVKKSEVGSDGLSIHNYKFRFPVVVSGGRRIRRIQFTTSDGVGLDVNNQSILVWVPRLLYDCGRHERYPGKEGWDVLFRAGVRAYQVAAVLASRLGVEIRFEGMEIVPPIHVASEFYMDFSRKVLELEKVAFGKKVPDFLPKRKLDYYL